MACGHDNHTFHIWSVVSGGSLYFFWFLHLLGGPGFDVTVLSATLGFSLAMTCMPSLVASNIQPISMADSRLRCLLFSRQHWRTCSSNDLQAMASQINFSVSVMARPRAKSFRSVTKISKVSPGNWHLQSNGTTAMIGFFLASTCALYLLGTLSSISFSLTFRAVSPVPTWTVCQSKVK